MLACSFAHERLYDLSKSRIHVVRNAEHAESTPRVCVQCEAAPCVPACPVSALSRVPATGAIQLNSEACIGCKRCVDACPYGGIGFHEEDQLPLLCDLCGGEPACVEFCQFTQAIRFESSEKEAE